MLLQRSLAAPKLTSSASIISAGVHISACRDKKGHTVRRGENFINNKTLNVDLFGWVLKPCYTIGRSGAEIQPHTEMNASRFPPLTPLPGKTKFRHVELCDAAYFQHITTTLVLSVAVPTLPVCWSVSPSGFQDFHFQRSLCRSTKEKITILQIIELLKQTDRGGERSVTLDQALPSLTETMERKCASLRKKTNKQTGNQDIQ